MTQVEDFFWMLMCIGATLTALAIAYRLGHTVGYKQAEKLTLPRFEIIDQPELLPTDTNEETVLAEERVKLWKIPS